MNIKKYPLAAILVLAGLCCSGRETALGKRVSVEFQDDFVITSVDTGPKHMLVVPYRMAIDREKRLYVLDLKASDVKVFDDRGHLIRVIGRLGQGPGELDSPNSLAVNENELAVGCRASFRVSFFDLRDGSFLRTARMFKGVDDFRIDAMGTAYATVTDVQKKVVELLQLDRSFKPVKTFLSRQWTQPNWLQASDWISLRADGTIVYALPIDHEYKILIFDATGTVVRTIGRDLAPTPVSKEDRALIEGMMKGAPKIEGFFDEIPEFYEPFYAMFTDEEGRVLVQTRTRRYPETCSWDAFDRDGRFLCSFDLPESEPNSLLWGHGRVYSRGEDADGNPTIRVRKVKWTAPGPAAAR
jgi:hypothetical protein